jgi:hypothetical protein
VAADGFSLIDYYKSWLDSITTGDYTSSIADHVRLYTNAAPDESIIDARRRLALASGTATDSNADLERKYWMYVGNETFTNADLKYVAYKGLAP